MYRDGKGVKRDAKTAIKYFDILNKLGNPYGDVQIGLLYLKGTCTDKKREKAITLIKGAATKGHSAAYHELGKMYLHGSNGVEKNEEKALKCFENAEKNYGNFGYQETKLKTLRYLSKMHKEGKGTKKDEQKSILYDSKCVRTIFSHRSKERTEKSGIILPGKSDF